MISLLIFALVVLCIVALAIWAVRTLPLPAPIGQVATVIVCIIGILVIAQKAGVV